MNIPFRCCLPCLLLVSLFPALTRGQSVDFIGKGNSAVSWGVVEVRDLDHKNSAEGEIGDRISVEIKNFDGWIIEQIAAGNYPETLKPSEKLAKLINLGLFKDAIDARNDAETPGGIRESWFRSDTDPNLQPQDKAPADFTTKYASLLKELQADYPKNPGQGAREAAAYMQTVFDSQIAGLRLKINDYTFSDIAPLSSRISAEATKGTDSYYSVPFTLDPRLDDDIWQKLRTRVFPWGTVTLTLVTKLTDREHNFPTAVFSLDDPQASTLKGNRFTLDTVDPGTLYAAIIVVLFLLALFISVAFRTDILRDPTRKLRSDLNFPFSLSRLQMAFWLFVVVSSFLFLFVATQKVTVLNVTCLWLIGIGSGTALGAAIITPGDTNNQIAANKAIQIKAEEDRNRFRVLRQKKRRGETLDPGQQAELETLEKVPKSYSGFASLRQLLMDVISDDTEGVAIYRFQMLAWTVALGFVFIFKVAVDRSIPTFDVATLGLLGISSGTYLGFKMQNDPAKTAKN
ncbi:MAG: hypothetical protein JO077_22345 [Verrucomicrobia bacterium]|nr:hypothetical protein [Verrucomicrobiota bacterium]